MSTADEHRTGSAPSEPLDADVQASGTDAPARLRAPDLLTVVTGGAAGSLARYALTLLLPITAGFDWPLLTVNLVGALFLGCLMEGLTRRRSVGPEPAGNRRLRLLVGTGFLGGFTTYSALVVGAVDPIGTAPVAVLQLVAIVAGGLLAAASGVRLGAGRS